jgi:DNA-binding transcriptional LysR family regulator
MDAPGGDEQMNLRQIEVFRAVFMARSVSGGARQLNIAQPSVSRMIRHLEKQLGYTLFELRMGRIAPTYQADRLFRETNGLFEQVQRVSDLASSLKTGVGERLAVVSYYSAAIQAVPKILHAVARKFPDTSFSLDTKSPSDQIEDIIRADADVGIAGNVPDLPSLEQRYLGHDELVAVLPRDHPAASRKVLGLADIAGMPCIAGPPNSPVGRMLRQTFKDHDVELKTQIAISSPVPIFELVRLFRGVALIGSMALRRMDGAEGLVIKPLEVSIQYPVSAFWSAHALSIRARNLFVDLLAEEFQQQSKDPLWLA